MSYISEVIITENSTGNTNQYKTIFCLTYTGKITNYLEGTELLAPENGSALEFGTLVTFRWTAVENAANYTLLIDTSKGFDTSNLVNITGINDTKYTLNISILDQHSYYWKVCAILYNGSIVSSDVWYFSIIPKREQPPQAFSWPVLISFIIFILALVIIGHKKKIF